MLSEKYKYINRIRPKFIDEINTEALISGSLLLAMEKFFTRKNIRVEVVGDSPVKKTGFGTLFIGDHRNGLEFLPLLGFFAQVEFGNISFVAKPFSTLAKFVNSFTIEDVRVLPVIPRTLAKDRKGVINRDIGWRVLQRNMLPTQEEIRKINARAISTAADILVSGSSVVMFPSGGVMDATENNWQRGVGKIVKSLHPDMHKSVDIAPFRFDDFSRIDLLRAMTSSSIPGTDLSLRFGKIGTITDIFGDKAVDEISPEAITRLLYEKYVSEFVI